MFKCSSQLYGLLSKRFYNCFDLRSVTVAILLFCKLTVVKFVIESAFGEQLLVCACFINAFILLPAYGKAFGMPVDAFIQMGSAVHGSVHNLLTFAALIIFPFNLFKYTLTSLIVFLIYKRIRVVLKGD